MRAELCQEAMRLTALLLEHPLAATPATHALAALMCLHAARLPARVDASGNLISLFDQDRSRWDAQLVAEGQKFLDLSATGSELTEYHVEAAIASVHAAGATHGGNRLGTDRFALRHVDDDTSFPVVALNRAIAIAQHEGPERGLEEIRGDRQPRSPRHLPFLPRRARRVRISQREIRNRARALPSGARPRAAIPWSDNSSSSALVRLNKPLRSVRVVARR